MIGRGGSSLLRKMTPQRGAARGLVVKTYRSGRGLTLTPRGCLLLSCARPGEVTGQQAQVVGQRAPSHIGLERSRPFPQTPFQTKAAQQRGEVALDPRAPAQQAAEPRRLLQTPSQFAQAPRLGQRDLLHAGRGGDFFIIFTVITPIGRQSPRRLAKHSPVIFERARQHRAVTRVAVKHLVARDQPRTSRRDIELVTELGLAALLAAANHGGVRLENRNQFLVGRDILTHNHTPMSLIVNLLGQRQHVLQLRDGPHDFNVARRSRLAVDRPPRVAAHLLLIVEQSFVKRLAPLLDVLALAHHDLVGPLLAGARMITVDNANGNRRGLAQALEQRRQHPDRIVEQTRVDRMRDVGLGHARVMAHRAAVFDFSLIPSRTTASLTFRIVWGEIILIRSLSRVKCGIFLP